MARRSVVMAKGCATASCLFLLSDYMRTDICEQFETYRREANEVILAIYFVLKQPVVEHLVDQVLTGQGKDSVSCLTCAAAVSC